MAAQRGVVLGPGEGRTYDMGHMRAVFKADGDETGDRFAVSEWWLKAGFEGPGAHSHADNDELFYVIQGEAAILVDDTWHHAPKGSFAFIPRGVTHDFRNESDALMGLLNVFVPGGFEPMMPAILEWYENNPGRRIGG